jgi:predicted ATPase/DNA-binding SARP family transcriptional activator
MPRLSLYLFGSFEARIDDTPLKGFDSDKVRALLAFLVLEANRPHTRESLTGLLWPDFPESSAKANLRNSLSNLRHVLCDKLASQSFLSITPENVQFNQSSDFWCDVTTFEQQYRAFNLPTSSPDLDNPSISQIETAIALYRGSLLEGFSLKDSPAFDDWLFLLREKLQHQALSVLNQLAEHYIQDEDFAKASFYTHRQVELEPWQEEAHRQLMRLLALSGQRSAALVQYEVCCRNLEAELGVEPTSETARLYEQIRDGKITGISREKPPSHNLPIQRTSFIGREREIDQIMKLLDEFALVSVVGPGGVGKTRTALQGVMTVLDQYKHGVWMVDLAALSDPEQVIPTFARSIGMHVDTGPEAEEALLAYCQKRKLLIVMDNCEHLIEPCAHLAEALLSSCPQVKILATSREMLGVPGEAIYPLVPFPTLYAEDSRSQISEYEAVRLFVDRAAMIQPDFALTPQNVEAVGKICNQLDGIPLAIELAAAWVRVLPVEGIHSRLRESLDYLRGPNRAALPRQQTMRGCLDWSYNLLSESEQKLLQALSVFSGSWTLDALEAVWAASRESQREVLELLDLLTMRSLVQVEHSPEIETRYRLLEPVRQYAQEKLYYSGNMETMRDRHLVFYQRLAKQAGPHLRTHQQIVWLRRLERELPNIRQALDWAYSEDGAMQRIECGLRLGADLRHFWHCRARGHEGIQRLERLLDLEKRRRGDQPITLSMSLARAWALTNAVALSVFDYPFDFATKADGFLTESLDLFKQAGEAGRQGALYNRYSRVVVNVDYSLISIKQAVAHLDEIFSEAEALEDQFLMAECLLHKGLYLSRYSDQLQAAEECLQKSIAISLAVGDKDSSPLIYSFMASAAFRAGEFDKARDLINLARSQLKVIEADLLGAAIFSYQELSTLAWRMGDYQEAEHDIRSCISIIEKFHGLYSFNESLLLGEIKFSGGDCDAAKLILDSLADTVPQKDYTNIFFEVHYLLGILDWVMGKYTEAKKRFTVLQDRAEVLEKTNRFYYQTLSEESLAKLYLSVRGFEQACQHLSRALRWQYEEKTNGWWLCSLTLAGVISSAFHQPEIAARLLSADIGYRFNRNIFSLFERQWYDRVLADVRDTLGDEAFTTAWEEGKALDRTQALAYALKVVNEIQTDNSTKTTDL